MHRRLDVDMMSSRRVWFLRSEALKGFDIYVAVIRDSWVAFFSHVTCTQWREGGVEAGNGKLKTPVFTL